MAADQHPFNEKELEQLRQNVSRLSEHGVREFYRHAWEDCRMKGELLPSAKAIQQLVQAWKQLWKWRND